MTNQSTSVNDPEKEFMRRRIDKLEGEVSLLKRQVSSMQLTLMSALKHFSTDILPAPPMPQPPAETTKTNVFVYGTLKRGFYNYEKYLGDNAVCGGSATFLGNCTTRNKVKLVICDYGVPAIIDDALGEGSLGSGKIVNGECFSVDSTKLRHLDQLEGVGDSEEEAGWCRYERRKIEIKMDSGDNLNVEGYILIGVNEASERAIAL